MSRLNYRLGPFGWLSHPALQDSDNPKDNSGNFGTLDIIKALEWIQENIEAFGGDPNRVLIAGESAGAINIQSLLISPLAKGLFHAAISQSGFPRIGDAELSKAMTDSIIMRLLIRKKIAKTDDEASDKLSKMTNSEIKEFLYAQDAKDIMRSIDPYIMGMVNMPFIFPDGYVIPKEGYTVLETGKNVNKVPIIIGSNTNEIKLFVYFSREPKWKDPLFQITTTFGSNMWKAIGVDDPARKLSALADHPPVYVYLFNFGNPDDTGESPLWGKWGKKLGAHHGAEIKFFTGTDKKRWAFLSIMNRNLYKAGRDSLTSDMIDLRQKITLLRRSKF
jgi:para-nitrobenzyl esterase